MRSPPTRVDRDDELDLVEHLGEFRTRLLLVLGTVVLAASCLYPFHGALIDLLNRPLPPAHRHPVTFSIAEPFTVTLKIVFAAAVLVSLPMLFWQLWAFLAPAMSPAAERLMSSLVGAASALLLASLLFAYLIVLPAAVHFLTSYDSVRFTIQVRATDYYSFAITVLMAVAVVFQLPIFVVALGRLRILDSARLRRNRGKGYFVVAAIAVALPGVDPVTTTLEMIPLMLLFELSIWGVVWFERRERAPAPSGEAHVG